MGHLWVKMQRAEKGLRGETSRSGGKRASHDLCTEEVGYFSAVCWRGGIVGLSSVW